MEAILEGWTGLVYNRPPATTCARAPAHAQHAFSNSILWRRCGPMVPWRLLLVAELHMLRPPSVWRQVDILPRMIARL